ncbi:MAG: glycosyltransferase [Gloeobacterales cyanobacterium]
MDKPVLTILLMARDRPHYIGATLDSISAQTLGDWALVLSDNSTSEANAQENNRQLEAFRSRHPDRPITYMRRNGAMTVNEHYIALVREVQTLLLAVHNDDDIWMPHHLEQSVGWLVEDERNGLVVSDAVLIDTQGQLLGSNLNWVEAPAEDDEYRWLHIWSRNDTSNFGNFPGMVMRTAMIQTLPNIPNILTDVFTAYWNTIRGYRHKCFVAPSYCYRKHSLTVSLLSKSLVMERHRLLVWLARHHFFSVVSRYPPFPLLVLKAMIALKLKYKESIHDCL